MDKSYDIKVANGFKRLKWSQAVDVDLIGYNIIKNTSNFMFWGKPVIKPLTIMKRNTTLHTIIVKWD